MSTFFSSTKKPITLLSFTEELELSVVCLQLSFLVSLELTPVSVYLQHPTEPVLTAEVSGQVLVLSSHSIVCQHFLCVVCYSLGL